MSQSPMLGKIPGSGIVKYNGSCYGNTSKVI